jgi:hypothetical protein
LVPVTKSGDQLQLGFHAFKENRLPFTVRVKDQHADTVGRILFMREPKVGHFEVILTNDTQKMMNSILGSQR